MRVLHVLNELRPSGAEVMLRLAAPHWRASGLDLGVLSIGHELGEYAVPLEEAGYALSHYPVVAAKDLLSPGFCRELGKKGDQWDAIHWHPERHAVLGAWVARWQGYRHTVRTVHSNFCFGWKARSRATLGRFLARTLGVQHVAISRSVEANEKRQFLNPCIRISNWIDTAHFRVPTEAERSAARSRLGLSDRDRWIVSVGNGSDVKNYRAIIAALPGVLAEHPNLYYAQVGRPHPKAVDSELAKSLGVAAHCRFVGPVADPRDWLWAADAYVMPSLIEGFGLAAAEALVCGSPCIFSRVPGLADWSEEDMPIIWSGIEPSSLVIALKECLSAIGRSHAAEGSIVLRDSLSPDKGAARYLELYRRATAC